MAKKVTIGIGEYYASKSPVIVNTLLGSCVSACLFDPVNRIGGMNHILLPGKADMNHFDNRARYGINAMELVVNRMMTLGANRKYLVAKVFGGANVLPDISKTYEIGRRNINFVRDFLFNEGIEIKSHDYGGYDIRKIYFYTGSGDVLLKRMEKRYSVNVSDRENKFLKIISEQIEKPGGIEIFDT